MNLKLIIGIPVCIVWFVLIHTIKMFRLYLVMLERRIDFKRFVFAYCRTTLANLIIPFKLGEIYRMIVFSRITDNAGMGIAGVIVDRFFDTFALVLILIPLHILDPSGISAVSVFLAVFVAVIVFVYIMFMPAYRYLNKFIIVNRNSRNSMAVLRLLEMLRSVYDYVRGLILGRYALMLLMSFAAWVLEGGLLFLMAGIMGAGYGARVFSDYITSILSTSYSRIQEIYTMFSIAAMGVCTLLSAIVFMINRAKGKNR